MNSAIGKNTIITHGEYYDLFMDLIAVFQDNREIKIDQIVNLLKIKYNEEEIKVSLRYLISREFLVYSDEGGKFQNRTVILDKKPVISLREDEKNSGPFIALTLPPFNYFGLKSSFKNHDISINYIKDEIKKLFMEANDSIYICSPFLDFEGIKDFLPLLVHKNKNGVKINIISRQINKKDNNSRFDVVKPVIKYFKENKCDVTIRNYHYQSKNYIESSTHAKFIVVDKKSAYLGSGELRKNSFEKNFELGLILGSVHAKELSVIFEEIFSISSDINE
ncbi:phospholipase D family protein [Methanobacterium sp.]|uniref:phospholipase D family protein n=1 Tax=Methanobacterium sp. TaxID=2164 RepID=UPI0025CEE771|nr:phospholipase D family protein [Methanobacterium sp.]MBI5458973.1 phospholipase D family protein [Methanobacterium sp.]